MATPSDKAKDMIDQGAEIADDAITTASNKASEATWRLRAAAEDAIDDGYDVLEEGLMCAKNMVRANPLASIAFVAAVAYIWGRIKG